MASKTDFELVAPERLLLEKPVEMVIVPGAEGNMGALHGHAPVISTLRPGVITVYEDRPTVSDSIFVAGGFVEVTPSRCTVLAEEAVSVNEIDPAAVEQTIRDLTEDLADATTPTERTRIEKALTVAQARRRAGTA